MSNAFTTKPKVSGFTAELARSRKKAAAASQSAQRRNFTQAPGMRPFTQSEREGKK